MAQLTEAVKREIGQRFVVGFHGKELSDDIKVLVKDFHVGGVILMKRNVQNAAQVRRIILELQTLAKEAGHQLPLLIGTDQENGLVSALTVADAATQLPGAMALAATGSVDIVKETYAASGTELKLLGLNWVYAPVADVNSDIRNPVIGVRSFGDDPRQVAEYVSAASAGLASAGIAPCAKHFPGHGDTHVDSHLALPRILKTLDEIRATELVPFKTLLGNLPEIATIMTGHMALPLVTGNDEPCSLSRRITTGILREEMGFMGVVVTDCLEMDAIAEPAQGGCGVEEGTVRAFEAQADMAMICHTMERQIGAIKKVWEAVYSGRLNGREVAAAGRRIQQLKERVVGDWPTVLAGLTRSEFSSEWQRLKANNELLSVKSYDQTIAVIRDPAQVLPLKAGKILLLTPEMESLNKAVDDAEGVLRGKGGQVRNTAGASFTAFCSAIQSRSPCHHVVYAADKATESLDRDASAVVLVLRNADRSGWQIEHLKQVLAENRQGIPVVLLASCTPYDLVGVEGVENHTYLATFEFTRESFEAATRVLFGEMAGRGRVPVSVI